MGIQQVLRHMLLSLKTVRIRHTAILKIDLKPMVKDSLQADFLHMKPPGRAPKTRRGEYFTVRNVKIASAV